VRDVLEELESELDGIVDSFETRLRKLKHDGENAFSGLIDDADMTGSTPEPEFSILPVPKDEVDREDATGDIPPVVIGRSKEEITDAFSRAGEGAGVIPPKAGSGVSESAEKVSVEEGQETSAAGHVEL
jgi:hypothetical protein